MSDTAPTARPAPGPPDKPLPDALEFVHNGIIRFHFPGAPVPRGAEPAELIIRVRRPFLGELKKIRLALADLQEETGVLATEVLVEGRRLQERATDLNDRLGAGTVTAEEHAAELAEIRAADKECARRMDDFREDRTLAWWADEVFAVLALDEVPDVMSYPAWILDARLPNHVLNHWRQVPTGPG